VFVLAQVDVLLYGADRVSANGDVANKIGTYQVTRVAVPRTSDPMDSRLLALFLSDFCGCARERYSGLSRGAHVNH
jgi:hypothetical protein